MQFASLQLAVFLSVPGKSRTCDQRFRKALLYPAELRGLVPGRAGPFAIAQMPGRSPQKVGPEGEAATGRAAPRLEVPEGRTQPGQEARRVCSGARDIRRAMLVGRGNEGRFG
jgi:hypothetical protein